MVLGILECKLRLRDVSAKSLVFYFAYMRIKDTNKNIFLQIPRLRLQLAFIGDTFCITQSFFHSGKQRVCKRH